VTDLNYREGEVAGSGCDRARLQAAARRDDLARRSRRVIANASLGTFSGPGSRLTLHRAASQAINPQEIET